MMVQKRRNDLRSKSLGKSEAAVLSIRIFKPRVSNYPRESDEVRDGDVLKNM